MNKLSALAATVGLTALATCALIALFAPNGIQAIFTPEITEDQIQLVPEIDLTEHDSIHLEIQPNQDDSGNLIPPTYRDLSSVRDTLAERIKLVAGLKAVINILPPNRIEIQTPNSELARTKEVIRRLTTAAKLTIHSVHPRNSDKAYTQSVFERKEIAPGYKAFPDFRKDEDGNIIETVYHLVRRKPGLTGKSVEQAWPSAHEPGAVNIKLTSDGANKMINFTKGLKVGDLIVTILDGRVINAASLRQETLGRNFQISGLDSAEECKELAEALLHPLSHNLKIITP